MPGRSRCHPPPHPLPVPPRSESKWAVQYWQATAPVPVEEAIAAQKDKSAGGARVCLVDFQQTTQMHPAIKESSVVGIIDHHALQSKTLTTKSPISVDIRPWGSTCTLLAEDYAAMGRTPSRATAGLMLSAMLSDTLNLKGPTTTHRDRRMVAQLAQQLGVADVDALAAELFKAKSAELATLSARELIEADMKEFSFADASGATQPPVAIATIETTDTAPVLARTAELQAEVRRVKKARSLDALLLTVVDIVNLQTSVILAGFTSAPPRFPRRSSLLPSSAAASRKCNRSAQPLTTDNCLSCSPCTPAPCVSIFCPAVALRTQTRTIQLLREWHFPMARLFRMRCVWAGDALVLCVNTLRCLMLHAQACTHGRTTARTRLSV